MAREYRDWECEVCGTHHLSEPEALKCERTHVTIENIKPSFYLPREPIYPESLFVTFSDGRIIRYSKP